MIYWFKRAEDGYIFALDEEEQASHIYYKKSVRSYVPNLEFEYLGMSDGNFFKDAMKGMRKWTKTEAVEKLAGSIQSGGSLGVEADKDQKDQYQYAWELELEHMKELNDKTPPRDVRKMDQVNSPILSAYMENMR